MNPDRILFRRYAASIASFGVLCSVVCGACSGKSSGDSGSNFLGGSGKRPDVLPVMLNKDLPFRYPPALYAEKTQGNVTLRLYIEKDGSVVDDSTRVAESSNVPMLDSAAIKGAHALRFLPAKLQGAAMPVSILFPVYFRHPEANPMPGDSTLKKSAPMPDTNAKQQK